MKRAFLVAAFPVFSIFLLCCAASAQISNTALEIVGNARTIEAAGPEGWRDAVDLLERALRSRKTAPPADRYALAGTAASMARSHGDRDRALANYAIAKASLTQMGGERERVSRITEIEVDLLLGMGRTDDAFEVYETELALGPDNQAPSPPTAANIAAALLAHAILSGDEQRVAAEIDRAAGHLTGTDFANARVVLVIAPVLAASFKWFGLYESMHQMVDIATGSFWELSGAFLTGDGPRGYEQVRVCALLDASMRDIAGLLRLSGNSGDASRILTQFKPPDACKPHLPASAALFRQSLEATIALASKNPFLAERHLTRVVGSLGTIGDNKQYRRIIRSRVARAQVQLGFLGKARAYFEAPESGEPLDAPTDEIDRLRGRAEYHDLSGRLENALLALEKAASLAAEKAPRDWLALSEIAYRRVFLLVELGRLEEASEVRNGFEDRYDRREKEPVFPNGTAEPRSNALKILSRLRLVADILFAVAEDDRTTAERKLKRVEPGALPSDPSIAHHVRRATLEACIMTKGVLRCKWDIDQAFRRPWITNFDAIFQIDELNLAGDRHRFNPIRDRMFEPVMARLWHAAQMAIADVPPGLFSDDSVARLIGRLDGGATAFRIAQEMFEGGAETAIRQIGPRIVAEDDRLASLLREQQELSERIARRMDAVLAGESGETPDADAQRLRAINRELQEKYSGYTRTFDTDPLYMFQIEELLAPDEAFLTIVSSEAATYVFAADAENFDWIRVPMGADSLGEKVLQLRRSLDQTGTVRAAESSYDDVGIEVAFDRQLAHQLYKDLIAPLENLIEGKTLYIALHGPLASLPLSVLVTKPPTGDDRDADALRATNWFIREHAFVVLPSPAALRLNALRSEKPDRSTRFVGFGDPVFATSEGASPPAGDSFNVSRSAALGQLARLPGTRREVEALASLFGDDDGHAIRLGSDATEAAVKKANFKGARVVAFATHGLLAGELGDNDEAGLAFSTPQQPDAADDGFLSTSEAATLSLDADWLLLSACNTASSDGRPDSSSLSGLASAFLFAGARSIMVSHWPVRDDAAAALTTKAIDWHMRNPDQSKGEALRQSILQLLDDTENPDLAHPAAWAPFVIVGDNR